MLTGIIDIGSNTVRLAVYLIEGSRMEMLMKKKHMVGLAAHVRDGVMQQSGIDAAVRVLQEFQSFLHTFQITAVYAFTTAALRNASNSREAVAEIEARTGLSIQVISGEREAEYDFIGATHSLAAEDGLLIDIGGGSTEIVSYENRSIRSKVSLPMGSLSMDSRFVAGVLPTRRECIAIRDEAERVMGAMEEFPERGEEIVGIGGAFKGGCALYDALFHQPATNVRMNADQLLSLISRFQSDHGISQEMTIMLMKTVPDRMETVIPGLIIAEVLADRFQCATITYSDSGVREGFLYAEVMKQG